MNPENLCLFKVNNQKKVRNMFTVNNIEVIDIVLVSPFLILSSFETYSCASVVNFEQVVPCRDR